MLRAMVPVDPEGSNVVIIALALAGTLNPKMPSPAQRVSAPQRVVSLGNRVGAIGSCILFLQ
jgi:hypothetical protein